MGLILLILKVYQFKGQMLEIREPQSIEKKILSPDSYIIFSLSTF
jgi:hypothetical protein